MKKILFAIAMALLMVACNSEKQTVSSSKEKLVDYINPLMGTASEFSFSNGNTYPAIATPWGMNFWTPQTAKMGDGWQYNYNAMKLRGLKQTHQPSPWINDYGAFSLMPITGKLVVDEEKRASWFSHKAETATPYYYSVYLSDYDVKAEVTPTDRAAQFRFTFPSTDSAYIIVDAYNKGSYVKIIPAERKIIGYSRNHHGGVPQNFHNYFVMQFDHDFVAAGTWDPKKISLDQLELSGEHVGGVVKFITKKGEQVNVRVASSFISAEQAQLNLDRELASDSFDATKVKAEGRWEKELSRIRVEGGTVQERQTFYSCLYRILLFPRSFYEYDVNNKVVHYSPYNGQVLPGYMFTDNGFWDTFRAVFPFFTVMYRDLDAKIMEGLVNAYKESGWLPEWASPGHRDCMIGSNSASLIADAYMKGIRGYDINVLYEAMLKNANHAGPMSSVGRLGADQYNKLGYVPYDVGINESAARTLEYAYDDFSVMQVAKALNKTEDVTRFQKQAMNYKNLFDPETKLMRGKNQDGKFQTPFNPFKWGDAFTEGNSWHYTWSVFQDIKGLVELMGGDEAFVDKLDAVFTMPPVFDESYYGIVIHEIREMQVMGMGQYAHGNQPIQHMVYLYNYAGQPWKTQLHVRNIMKKLYHSGPDGYCGDEDNGQTSAWYVFSAMGFYPVCPGSNQYVIGSPLFNKVTLTLENGKQFVIDATANNASNIYIKNASLNGAALDANWLDHDVIMKGGTLSLDMDSVANTNRGISESARPFSMSGSK
ncbi:GH92 family glycosyl hydrolase [Pseudochryseolinea flava]|uniref:Glycoside hydrolase family 92 protein n=1 Tax=Pseudochryseolinea flava TaxID=2059302 RepID=A0A364Y8T0_9BACT|nr:GH92 family glycosyl hydrolase [Pseudochryseolinea flava]RAW03516.1 glycoside hydrolase family 92 protein [Pseudochryseolinea flava]